MDLRSGLIFMVLLLATVCGCAGPASETASGGQGAGEAPSWVGVKPRNTESTLYFVGVGGARATGSDAVQAAVVQASAQIANYFGALVKVVSSDVQGVRNGVDENQFTISATVVGTPVVLRGLEQRQSWCTGRAPRVECRVLVAYPVVEFQRAKAEITAAESEYRLRKSQAAARSLALYRQALNDEGVGRFDSAMAALEQAAGIVGGFEVAVSLEDGALTNTDLLKSAIAGAMARVGPKNADSAGWLSVGVLTMVDGVKSDAAGQKIFAGVTGLAQPAGLKTRAASIPAAELPQCLDGDPSAVRMRAGGAAHMLVIDLASNFSSEMYGQYFARASGRWALVESKSGNVLVSGPVSDEKGAGVTRESACVNAVEKAWANQIRAGVAAALGGIRRSGR